ncbi:uncharacterized protein LOC116010989 [Ipomoea triloba]|uniref:uncharacterized protein LOC116010989 n=1 Tax=Ipomoea triloba TaxID=35885 RepID=UPI00125D0582|nr:uncharacterized protein LOC116010989 [Ipomoea triloba]
MFVVAQGTAYPTTAKTTIVHNQPVLPNHVKVMVDEVVIGAEDCPLPVPVLQYKTLNDVVGTYTQWPIHLVLLDEANVKIRSPRQNKPIKDPSVDLSTAATRRLGQIVGENVFMLLGKNCKRLVKTLTSFPGDKEYLDVDLDPTVFHHGNVNGVFVMLEDIKDLLTMNWLDVSVIQVFMMFLNSLCKQYGVASIGFACPTQISADMVNKNPETITSYLIHVMDTHKDQQFILAPYHQENHWLLIVICINLKTVYVFDPLKCGRTLEVKPSMNMAFRSVPTNGRGVRSMTWKECKCPQQPGGFECGYYTMRFMCDIVTKCSMLDRLDTALEDTTYSMNEIEEVRELWAKYFLEECV